MYFSGITIPVSGLEGNLYLTGDLSNATSVANIVTSLPAYASCTPGLHGGDSQVKGSDKEVFSEGVASLVYVEVMVTTTITAQKARRTARPLQTTQPAEGDVGLACLPNA